MKQVNTKIPMKEKTDATLIYTSCLGRIKTNYSKKRLSTPTLYQEK